MPASQIILLGIGADSNIGVFITSGLGDYGREAIYVAGTDAIVGGILGIDALILGSVTGSYAITSGGVSGGDAIVGGVTGSDAQRTS